MSFKYNFSQSGTSFKVRIFNLIKRLFAIPRYLGVWEKRIIIFLLLIAFVSAAMLLKNKITAQLIDVPAYGGSYIEGTVGEPKYINPIYAQSDSDRDLVELIFSGLTKYDNNKIVPDLAESWQVTKDQKGYTFKLKKNIFWQDGEPVIADDILYTISVIQEPEYEGPYSGEWQGISLEKIDDTTLKFSMEKPFAPFLSMTMIKILPSHILSELSSADLYESEFNLSPIGCGPYQLNSISDNRRNKTIELKFFDQYYGQKPFIEKISFKFYKNWDQLIKAYKSHEILGISQIPADNYNQTSHLSGLNIYSSSLPEYSAIFLNLANPAFSDSNLRKALAKSIDRSKIINEILNKQAKMVDNFILAKDSILPNEITFNPQEAKQLLNQSGYNEIDGRRIKEGKKLELSLVTVDNEVDQEIAQLVKKFWEDIGIKTSLVKYNLDMVNTEVFEKRNFDVLLFGENLGCDSDPYSFWHSSQITPVGFNISGFSNESVDKLLIQAQGNFDPGKRNQYYQEINKIIVQEAPAIFLYQPIYNFGISATVKGVLGHDLVYKSSRFSEISGWYIKTKKARK